MLQWERYVPQISESNYEKLANGDTIQLVQFTTLLMPRGTFKHAGLFFVLKIRGTKNYPSREETRKGNHRCGSGSHASVLKGRQTHYPADTSFFTYTKNYGHLHLNAVVGNMSACNIFTRLYCPYLVGG